MTLSKQVLTILLLLTISTNVNAQLWRYLNDSPEKQKAADLAVEREASSVKTCYAIVYSDTLKYKIISYDIEALDSLSDKVGMYYKPFSGQFIIRSTSDSLRIYNFYSIDSVHFLNKNFLELIYSPRGGSDDGFQNTAIIYINKGKIGIAMEIETDHQFSLYEGDGWGEYYATVKLTGENRNNYKLLIKTNDRLYSKSKHAKNHNLTHHFTLNYDAKRNVFYNNLKIVNGWFDVWNYTINKFKSKHFKANCPAIKLDNREYYCIGNLWFTKSKNVFNGKDALISDWSKMNN